MNAAYAYISGDHSDISKGANLRNGSNHLPATTTEGALLFFVAVAGCIGNILAIAITVSCPAFRRMSTAFIFHHCLLDAIKSCFCIPFGYSLIQNTEIAHCEIIGSTYILLMTVSAYNLLALLINEEYQSSLSKHAYHKSEDACCITFGIIIIWFTTILLHLGVIFLPGKSEFSREIGNCVYLYGVTKNYVIHALWVILVTGALTVAVTSFLNFFKKLQSRVHSHKWAFLHKSLSPLTHNCVSNDNLGEEIHYEFDDLSSRKAVELSRQCLKRIVIMLCMIVSFIICWYPLFILTLTDIHFKQPAHIYRRLMILAWSHPITTPFFCGIIYHNTSKGRQASKELYTSAIPMTASRSGDAIRPEMCQASGLAFRNEHFPPMANHSGAPPAREQLSSENSSPEHNAVNPFETIINYNAEDGRYQTLIM